MFTEHSSTVSAYLTSSGTLRILEKIFFCTQVRETNQKGVFSPSGYIHLSEFYLCSMIIHTLFTNYHLRSMG